MPEPIEPTARDDLKKIARDTTLRLMHDYNLQNGDNLYQQIRNVQQATAAVLQQQTK